MTVCKGIFQGDGFLTSRGSRSWAEAWGTPRPLLTSLALHNWTCPWPCGRGSPRTPNLFWDQKPRLPGGQAGAPASPGGPAGRPAGHFYGDGDPRGRRGCVPTACLFLLPGCQKPENLIQRCVPRSTWSRRGPGVTALVSAAPRPQILRAVGRRWARATSPVTPGTAGLLRPPCERQVVGAQLTPEPARSGNSPTPCWPQAFGGQVGSGLGCGPHPHACPNPSWPLRTTAHGRPGSRCPLLSCPSSLPGQALLHSLCSENFIKPLVVPFGVTESQIIVPTENRFLLPLTHPLPSPLPTVVIFSRSQ